ncbi:MAG: HEAT repeat domain-containing protein [Acidobacteria bacterium]|nr:HEAT repeat domain-containing protein [Acidobacteriota bacterium]
MLSLPILLFSLKVQAVLVGIFLLALAVLRRRIESRMLKVEAAARALEPVLNDWLVLDTGVERVVEALRRFPPHAAFRGLARLVTRLVTFEQQQALARALRHEPWVQGILRGGRSRFWWRRFDVARLLSVVGGEEDVELIRSLLSDRNPAVRLVAFDAAARLSGPQLIEGALDDLPTRLDAVQAYQFAALARHPRQVAEALLPRFTSDAPVPALIAWIDAAGALAVPEALRRVRDFASHPQPEVRVHVARALRRLVEPDTPGVLLVLLTDHDWRVRGQAARALGALRVMNATDALASAVRDPAWWVRYRSALALAQVGGVARSALLAITTGDDPMARDMSRLVAGLSPAAVVEMSEV